MAVASPLTARGTLRLCQRSPHITASDQRETTQWPALRLPVEDLRPPQQLDARGLAVLETITRVLTDAGMDELDRAGLETLALGRVALLGTDDQALAAYATAADYLNVTGTVPGLVVDGWQADATAVRHWFTASGNVDRLVAELDRARSEREQAKATARRAVVAREVDDDQLTAERATLAARLIRLADSIEGRRLGVLGDEQRDAAKGVRAVLLILRRQVVDCRSRTRLTERAAEPLHVAESIAQAAAREKARRAAGPPARRPSKHGRPSAIVCSHAKPHRPGGRGCVRSWPPSSTRPSRSRRFTSGPRLAPQRTRSPCSRSWRSTVGRC